MSSFFFLSAGAFYSLLFFLCTGTVALRVFILKLNAKHVHAWRVVSIMFTILTLRQLEPHVYVNTGQNAENHEIINAWHACTYINACRRSKSGTWRSRSVTRRSQQWSMHIATKCMHLRPNSPNSRHTPLATLPAALHRCGSKPPHWLQSTQNFHYELVNCFLFCFFQGV